MEVTSDTTGETLETDGCERQTNESVRNDQSISEVRIHTILHDR